MAERITREVFLGEGPTPEQLRRACVGARCAELGISLDDWEQAMNVGGHYQPPHPDWRAEAELGRRRRNRAIELGIMTGPGSDLARMTAKSRAIHEAGAAILAAAMGSAA